MQSSFIRDESRSFSYHTLRPERGLIPILFALLVCSVCPGQSQETNPTILDTVVAHEKLSDALNHLADGHFETAREEFGAISSLEQELNLFGPGHEILTYYDGLREKMRKFYRETYEEYVKNIDQAIAKAQWHQALLTASKNFSLETEEKTEFEEEASNDYSGNIIVALSQMAALQSLQERTGLDLPLDPNKQQKVINHSLAIAKDLEAEEKWLTSYRRIYSYLVSLDKSNDQYEEQTKRLLRQATLVSMYVPDPNQDAVHWEDRRKNISFSMLRKGLFRLNRSYVDPPDYQGMVESGLSYCKYLATTPKLSETFPGLLAKEGVESFLQNLDDLDRDVSSMSPDQFDANQVLEYLRKVQQLNNESIQLPEEVVMAEYAEGAFSALDGYTYLIWPGDVEDFQKDMTSEFFGIGVVITKNKDGLLMIDSLLSDSPAFKAGLDAGDTILEIDGHKTNNITMEMAVRRITGPESTNVVLKIGREDFEQPTDFTIIRGKIVVRGVEGLYRQENGQWQYFLDEKEKLAYVRLKGFYRPTAGRLRELLLELSQQNMKGLILDLRRNSGGFLSSAINIVSTFIPPGNVVVSTKPRDSRGSQIDRSSPAWTLDTDIPMVILVDSLSASASEIVSGALQVHGRALVVGTRTFGKGNVQTIEELPATDAEMKMTIAYYYLPDNRRVHRNPKDRMAEDYGVLPDVLVELTNKQFLEISDLRRYGSILSQDSGPADDPDGRKHYTTEDMITKDPQLEAALLCLQAKLLAQQVQTPNFRELVSK
jgi:carboxyl-terminal processing protease